MYRKKQKLSTALAAALCLSIAVPGGSAQAKSLEQQRQNAQQQIKDIKADINCVVGLTVYFVFLMLSGLQRVHPDRCTLSRTDLLQSFLPPTWRQSFPCWAD